MGAEKQNGKLKASSLEQVGELPPAGSDGGCTIIPFRKRDLGEMPACGELDRDSEAAEGSEDEPFAEMDEIPVVCVPWVEEVDARQRHTPSSIPHWVRTVLLIAVSTVCTATAVAICLSLG